MREEDPSSDTKIIELGCQKGSDCVVKENLNFCDTIETEDSKKWLLIFYKFCVGSFIACLHIEGFSANFLF